jgi:hypothetical protein
LSWKNRTLTVSYNDTQWVKVESNIAQLGPGHYCIQLPEGVTINEAYSTTTITAISPYANTPLWKALHDETETQTDLSQRRIRLNERESTETKESSEKITKGTTGIKI